MLFLIKQLFLYGILYCTVNRTSDLTWNRNTFGTTKTKFKRKNGFW